MSIQLLDKTRKINKLLHNNATSIFVFSDVCAVLSDVLASNVLVISRSGKLLGSGVNKAVRPMEEYIACKVGEYVDQALNERLLEILSTKENVNLMTLGFDENNSHNYSAIIIPIDIAGERLGTLFIYRNGSQYGIEDIILSEYGNTVVGLEMLRSVSEENDRDIRNKSVIDGAINSMSLSERQAIKAVLKRLDGNEGVIVASKIAEDTGITRSVLVNALRKFVSAGIIYTRSNGMKGTYIKVLNDNIYQALDHY